MREQSYGRLNVLYTSPIATVPEIQSRLYKFIYDGTRDISGSMQYS